MPAHKLRRIDLSTSNAAAQIIKLRDQFRIDAEVVSSASKKLTQAVFGAALSPAQAAARICGEVRDKGLVAVLHYTELLDKVKLKPEMVRVPQTELAEAHAAASPDFLEVIRQIQYNVIQFQSGLLHRDAEMRVSGLHELHLRYRPMERVGVYCPGGAAAYPSTLMMTVCPAQAAGVESENIIVCMPPKNTGAYNRDMLATCHELGIREVYRLGGAQAIAAMAYGVEGIKPVDMIVGPGNQYVALAKKYVFGQVAIDCIAGPSEIVVAADDSAHPDYLALDMIAQAEHSPGVAILVTWYEPLVNEVMESLQKRLAKIARADLARESLERFGALVFAPDKRAAIDCVNAPGAGASAHSRCATRRRSARNHERRRDLPRSVLAGGRRRLRRGTVARPADGRHGPLRQRLERQRLPQAHQHHAPSAARDSSRSHPTSSTSPTPRA